jgi:hypothetical protein
MLLLFMDKSVEEDIESSEAVVRRIAGKRILVIDKSRGEVCESLP